MLTARPVVLPTSTSGVLVEGAEPIATLAEAAAFVGSPGADTDEVQAGVLTDMLESASRTVEGEDGLTGQWFRRATVTATYAAWRFGAADYMQPGGVATGAATAALVPRQALPPAVQGSKPVDYGNVALTHSLVNVPTFTPPDGAPTVLTLTYPVGGTVPAVAKQAVLQVVASLWVQRSQSGDGSVDWSALGRLLSSVTVGPVQ